MEKISVIMPVYNVEKYIRECVDSVLDQTFTDFELIIVDDGSTDKSGEIADQYQKKDHRIRVIHTSNGGVSKARNTALKECKGEYVYIMDSDDYLERNALESMYNEAIRSGADVTICDHFTFVSREEQKPSHFFSKEFVTSDRKIIQQIQDMVLYSKYSPFLTAENCGLGIAAPWTKLIKRSLIDQNNLEFDPYVMGVFDDGLFSLYVFEYAAKVSYIREMTYHYRVLQSSLIHRFRNNQLEVFERIFSRIDQFIKSNGKKEEFINAYHARIILYLEKAYRTYFFNKENRKSVKEKYTEYIDTMRSERYSTAIRQVEVDKLNKSQKRIVLAARLHLNSVLWLTYLVKNKLKGR